MLQVSFFEKEKRSSFCLIAMLYCVYTGWDPAAEC